jgi:hypothetical protein
LRYIARQLILSEHIRQVGEHPRFVSHDDVAVSVLVAIQNATYELAIVALPCLIEQHPIDLHVAHNLFHMTLC